MGVHTIADLVVLDCTARNVDGWIGKAFALVINTTYWMTHATAPAGSRPVEGVQVLGVGQPGVAHHAACACPVTTYSPATIQLRLPEPASEVTRTCQ
eukprot:360704-Chlamydomonas_euryale.AAC.2